MSLANLFEHGGADGEAQGDDRRFVPIGSTRSGAVGSVYWELTGHPRGGDFRRLAQDATLTIDAEHTGELYGKLPDGRRIRITSRAVKALAPQRRFVHDLR